MLGRAVRWLLRRVLNSHARREGASPGGQPAASSRRLVRDPVCGIHVAQELAVPLRDGNELVHFCSVACRDQYAFAVGRKAANG